MSDLEHGSTVGGSPIVTQRNYPNHQHNAEDIRQLGNSALYDKSDSYGSDDTNSIATSKALYDLRDEFSSQFMLDHGFNTHSLDQPGTSDAILILCPEGAGDYEAMGSVFIQRSTGNYSARKVNILYSTTSSGNSYNYDAALDYTLTGQYASNEGWNLVRFTYNGSNLIGLRRTGSSLYWFSSGFFVGNNTWSDSDALTWVNTSSVTSLSTLNYNNSRHVFKGDLYRNNEPSYSLSWGSVQITGYQNWWDAVVNYTAPHGSVIVGEYSYHNNSTEDRRFRFRYRSVSL